MTTASDPRQEDQKSTGSRDRKAKRAATALVPTSGARPASSSLSTLQATGLVRQIDFRSIAATEYSLQKLNFDKSMVEPVMTQLCVTSPSHAMKFAKAIIRQSIADEDSPNHEQLRTLVNCGCGRARAKAEIRSLLCTAFKQSRMNLVLVHGIAELKKTDARAYMKEYFVQVDDMRPILQWLEIAGETLRNQEPRFETDKKAVKAVGDFIEDAVDVAGDLVATVVDSVKSAGKSVAKALRDTIKWSMKQVSNLVHSLIEAGEELGNILQAAMKLGLSTLKKYVKAVIDATRSVVDIVSWAARQTVHTIVTICVEIPAHMIKDFFKGIMQAGKSALKILKVAFKLSVTVLALALTAFLDIWGGHRQLTAEERKEARKVFGWSIDLDQIKVAVASIPADIITWLNGSRPFTTMYIINFASWTKITMGTIMHELTHVWQGVVDGPVYMVEALESQLFGKEYRVSAKDLVNARGDIGNLEPEQQAVVVERYWRSRYNNDQRWRWQAYEPLARQVYRPKPKPLPSGNQRPPRDFIERPLVPGGPIP